MMLSGTDAARKQKSKKMVVLKEKNESDERGLELRIRSWRSHLHNEPQITQVVADFSLRASA
jgi:hypothetical protein